MLRVVLRIGCKGVKVLASIAFTAQRRALFCAYPNNYQVHYNQIADKLETRDPAMAALIRSSGPLPDRTERDPYRSLVDAIVSQQISTAAAKNIFARLESRFGGVLDPSILRSTDPETFRECGVSKQKATYIVAISDAFMERTDELAKMPEMSDHQVVSMLTEIKGVGVWTAQMFLMFTLCRPDVFPVGDFAIRKAMHQLYGWKTERKHSTLTNKAAKWAPYRSYASMALWRSLDA